MKIVTWCWGWLLLDRALDPTQGARVYKPLSLSGQSELIMRPLELLTLPLLCVTVSCLPGPDPNAYYFSKTVWVNDTDKRNASSSKPDRGNI